MTAARNELGWEGVHPLLAKWFYNRFTEPTKIQTLAWPRIAAGKHVLLTAPTGTGKTLAVFLIALNRLINGTSDAGKTRVLYISPLKALNNDIRENLTQPLLELRMLFEREGESFPDIRAVTRSGDTPQSERQRMLKKPPEILITTPESLNLLLSSPKARYVLSSVETVILDEIHAVAAGKRGTHLITAVERLTLLAGEFQRIAVSATARPLSVIADFIGGYRVVSPGNGGGPGESRYEKRLVEIVEAVSSKQISLKVEYPISEIRTSGKDTVWEQIAEAVREIIKNRSSTLVFVNSRRLAENLTHIINTDGEMIAYAHHGSLSREIRHIVEKRLKAGELSAIVATASLEMGIDIGDLDQVVLVQTPFSVSQAVQRIGRAGHSIEKTSAGVLYPSFGIDLVRAAVMAELVMNKDVEDVKPVTCPLDVLSQVLISMLGVSRWNLKSLLEFLRCAAPFHELAERDYRGVLEMLAGRYRDTRIRELHPRITIDRLSDTAGARKGALLLVYSSGGTIPDRGYYSLCIRGSQAKLGELDEEFVWERKTGDTFTLGTQRWKVTKIDHQKVEVVPWRGPVKIQPFWKGETAARDFHFSLKTLELLETLNEQRDTADLAAVLMRRFPLSGDAAQALVSFIARQTGSSGAELPHRHHILIEHAADPSTGGELCRTFVHTLWGNRVNYPLSLVLAAMCDRKHFSVEIMSDNDVVMFQTPAAGLLDDELPFEGFSVADLLASIELDEIDELIRQRLERGGYFGSRFRENAGRALLLPRSRAGKRTPLWVNRLKAKKLMDAVRAYKDFPILVETWRTCIHDEFDLDALKMLIQEVQSGKIKITEVTTETPSPFAGGSIWQATNSRLYGDDTPSLASGISVDESILKEAVFTESLRAEIRKDDLEVFVRKVQRTEQGYAPTDPDELAEWVSDRLLIPLAEWDALLAAVAGDAGIAPEESAAAISSRCLIVRLPGADSNCVCSVYGLSLLCEAFGFAPADVANRALPGGDTALLTGMARTLVTQRRADELREPVAPEPLLSQWLSYYGPVSMKLVFAVFGNLAVEEAFPRLSEEKSVVIGRLTEGAASEEICDAENLERLLAFGRRRRRSGIEPSPAFKLVSFLPRWQRVNLRGSGPDVLKKALAPLLCYPAAAGKWEEDILPARLTNYQTGWLDELLRSTDLEWVGCGKGKVAFCFPEEEVSAGGDPPPEGSMPAPEEPFVDRLAGGLAGGLGRYSFWDLKELSGLGSADFTKLLWDLVWKGAVRCDSYEPVRNLVLQGFKTPEASDFRRARDARSRRRTAGLSQWKISRPVAGNWYLAPWYVSEERTNRDARWDVGKDARGHAHKEAHRDPLDEVELNRDRVRLLLARYGIIFRELLANEAEPLRWGRLFRTMRLMELSGEITGGYFFEGISGIQFALPAALKTLLDTDKEEEVFLLNAADPASLCGVDVPALKALLPERFASTYIVYHGDRIVIVARKRGADLEISVRPDDEVLRECIDALRRITKRSFHPQNAIRIKTINGKQAADGEYGDLLEECGFVRDYQGYTGWAL